MGTLYNQIERERPLVSVCMPAYNQANFIEQAIIGVLEQKESNFELIIANDASTDDTYRICEKYLLLHPDKIKLINQSLNKGIIKNTQDCLFASNGEYIAICEGDDYWIDPLKLKKQTDILASRPEVSMVHSNWVNYFEEIRRFEQHKVLDDIYICEKLNGKDSVEEIMAERYRGIRFSSICFRRQSLVKVIENDIDFFSPQYSTLDIGFFYELAFQGTFAYLKEDTVVYRILKESVSRTSDELKQIIFTKGVLYLQANFINRFHLSNTIKDKIFRRNFQSLFPYALEKKDTILAKELKILATKNGYSLRIGQSLCYYGCKNKWLSCIVKILRKSIVIICKNSFKSSIFN